MCSVHVIVYTVVLMLCVCVCVCVCRFSSRELVGVVSVPLENADIYGVTVKSRIEQKDSGGEVGAL